MAQSILLQLESTENLLRADGCFWRHAHGWEHSPSLGQLLKKAVQEVLGKSTLSIPESKWFGV